MQVTAYRGQTVPDRGVVRSCDRLQNSGGCNHITGTAEPKVVKFCTQVGYINSNNRITYHQQKGHGYGHVTVSKFCRCSDAARRDGWSATAELIVKFLKIVKIMTSAVLDLKN